MAEDKNKKKIEAELNDEQLDEVNGGADKGSIAPSAEFPQAKFY